jgi:hypothetical protein
MMCKGRADNCNGKGLRNNVMSQGRSYILTGNDYQGKGYPGRIFVPAAPIGGPPTTEAPVVRVTPYLQQPCKSEAAVVPPEPVTLQPPLPDLKNKKKDVKPDVPHFIPGPVSMGSSSGLTDADVADDSSSDESDEYCAHFSTIMLNL